jgi:plasmid stabilization system protein ParE
MAVTLVWTKRAMQGYARIVQYLENEWTEKEVQNFIRETKYFFDLLQKNPHIFEPTKRYKDLYRGPVNRLTILTYRYKPIKKEIILINIREANRKPLK